MDKISENKADPPLPEGATADLPHDRITLARFRQAFPRARWSDRLNAWFVPGRTAKNRVSRWLVEIEAEAEAFADEKGRDAYAFDPIKSRYLKAASPNLQISTPYSRSVIEAVRSIPYARWDADHRFWIVPYRSFEELKACWPRIEAAAQRSEPEARRSRREAIRGTEQDEARKAKARERRQKRYPVPADDWPPLEHGTGTHVGTVVFVGSAGELADKATVEAFYFPVLPDQEYVWASWRLGSLEELIATWPARSQPGKDELERGWWPPTLEELRIARRDARSRGRAQQRRKGEGSALAPQAR